MPSARWTRLIDAVFSHEVPEPQWLGAVAEAARAAFGEGEGVAAYLWNMEPAPSVGTIQGDSEIAQLPMTVHDEMPPHLVRAAYGDTPRALPVSWAWATPQGPRLPPRFASNLKALDLVDGYAVLSPVGVQGLAIGLGMPRRRLESKSGLRLEQVNQQWSGVARHISLSLSLRRRLGPAVDALAAPETAWSDSFAFEALLEGRWSIVKVDQHRRTQRYLLVENHDRLRTPRPMEREVLERCLAGQPLKRQALDLGVAESTVATALSKALSRVGVPSVVELQRLRAALKRK